MYIAIFMSKENPLVYDKIEVTYGIKSTDNAIFHNKDEAYYGLAYSCLYRVRINMVLRFTKITSSKVISLSEDRFKLERIVRLLKYMDSK